MYPETDSNSKWSSISFLVVLAALIAFAILLAAGVFSPDEGDQAPSTTEPIVAPQDDDQTVVKPQPTNPPANQPVVEETETQTSVELSPSSVCYFDAVLGQWECSQEIVPQDPPCVVTTVFNLNSSSEEPSSQRVEATDECQITSQRYAVFDSYDDVCAQDHDLDNRWLEGSEVRIGPSQWNGLSICWQLEDASGDFRYRQMTIDGVTTMPTWPPVDEQAVVYEDNQAVLTYVPSFMTQACLDKVHQTGGIIDQAQPKGCLHDLAYNTEVLGCYYLGFCQVSSNLDSSEDEGKPYFTIEWGQEPCGSEKHYRVFQELAANCRVDLDTAPNCCFGVGQTWVVIDYTDIPSCLLYQGCGPVPDCWEICSIKWFDSVGEINFIVAPPYAAPNELVLTVAPSGAHREYKIYLGAVDGPVNCDGQTTQDCLAIIDNCSDCVVWDAWYTPFEPIVGVSWAWVADKKSDTDTGDTEAVADFSICDQPAKALSAVYADDVSRYIYVAQPGDNLTLLARRSVQLYTGGLSQELETAQVIAAETYIVQTMGAFELDVNQRVEIQADLVARCSAKAISLSQDAIDRWDAYRPIDETIEEITPIN